MEVGSRREVVTFVTPLCFFLTGKMRTCGSVINSHQTGDSISQILCHMCSVATILSTPTHLSAEH